MSLGAGSSGGSGTAGQRHDGPPERPGREGIAAAVRAIAGHPLMGAVLDAAEVFLMVVNRERRVVAVNRELSDLAGAGSPERLIGLRPGEALGCVEAEHAPDGCGSGARCPVCGALATFLASIATRQPAAGECVLTFQRDSHIEVREFRVRSTPIELDGEPLTVVSLRDVSAERRRETLEWVFLHDLMNTIGGLRGWSSLLQETCDGEPRAIAERIAGLSERLRDEVEEHRTLLYAEEGKLVPQLAPTTADAVLADVERTYRAHRAAEDRTLDVTRGSGAGAVVTDRPLLVRIVGNMVKNAFEAVPPGATVRVWSDGDAAECRFHVWNPGAIPPDVQLRIFLRSFSTKPGPGRGLGTFAMRLLGERYLGGRVGFTSSAEEGTTFTIALPRGGARQVGGRES